MAIKFSSNQNDAGHSLGSYLQTSREARNYSIEDVTKGTKIKKAHIQAIERDDIIEMVGIAYAKLLILNYAQFLNVDRDKVITLFEEQVDSIRKKESETPTIGKQNKKKEQGKKILISKKVFQIVGVIIFIVVILLISHYLYNKGIVQRDDISSENSLPVDSVSNTSFSDTQGHNLDKTKDFIYRTENFLTRYILDEDSPWNIVPKYLKHEQIKNFDRGTTEKG
jgi:cytoskeletal protein RodZ